MLKKIGLILFAGVMLFACSNDIEEELTTGDIVGSVSDMTTGEPVGTVNVVLQPGGKSTVTGSDGTFSYKDLAPGTYTIEINKEGYLPNDKEITVVAGETSPAHLMIERIPAIVTVDRKTLDFGNSKSLNTMSFSIVNRTYEDLAWNIEQNCEWITEVKPSSGTLAYGKTESIVVVIDRSKFEGAEKTSLVVRSSNGYSEIEILATSGDRPKLEMYDATEVRAYSATLNAEVTFVGKPEYIERGFVYGTTVNPTTENNLEKVSVPKNSTAKYSATIENLNINTSYYARAYAITALGTTYSSTNKVFTTHAILPEVTTLEPTDIEGTTATFKGTIVSGGEPVYNECGFVYGTSPNPTINDNKVIMDISGEGTFTLYRTGLPNKTYYVRAYAINEAGIAYGENVEVTYLPYVIIPNSNLMVQKEDLGWMYWDDANRACNNSVVGGFSDWRLPTLDELSLIYQNKQYIGNIKGGEYWSKNSEKALDMRYGSSENSSGYACYVRAVRTVTK